MFTELMHSTGVVTLADSELDLDMVVIFGVLGVVGTVAVVFGTVASTLNRRQREQTKREIAAYVAEGAISPEDAKKIIEAKEPEE